MAWEEKGQCVLRTLWDPATGEGENGGKHAGGTDASPRTSFRRAPCGFSFEQQNVNPIHQLFFVVLFRLSASPSACPQVGQAESQREIFLRP